MQADLIKRDTVEEIVALYDMVCKETRECYARLEVAETTFRARVYQYGRLAKQSNYTDWGESTVAGILKDLKAQTWRGIIAKLNVRTMMDSKRKADLDKQLETGEGLPDITTESILSVVGSMLSQLGDFTKSTICEAFEIIRLKSEGYKSTGQAWKVSNKAVLTYMVDLGYGGKPYRTHYRSEDTINTIETAFRLLDGKGPLKNNNADLVAAINDSATGEGETDYFRFRAHKNGNLHIWFKRMDLVAAMNETAGGENVLKG